MWGGALLDAALAVPAVLSASIKVARMEQKLPFDRLVESLRSGRGMLDRLGSPRSQARVALRLVRVLPPWGMGPCLKRSLILLQLWTARGVEVRLHLGVRRLDQGRPEGHAWLSTEDPELNRLGGAPSGAVEAIEL